MPGQRLRGGGKEVLSVYERREAMVQARFELAQLWRKVPVKVRLHLHHVEQHVVPH